MPAIATAARVVMVKNVWIVRDYIEEEGVRRAMVVVDLQTEEKNKNKNVSV